MSGKALDLRLLRIWKTLRYAFDLASELKAASRTALHARLWPTNFLDVWTLTLFELECP